MASISPSSDHVVSKDAGARIKALTREVGSLKEDLRRETKRRERSVAQVSELQERCSHHEARVRELDYANSKLVAQVEELSSKSQGLTRRYQQALSSVQADVAEAEAKHISRCQRLVGSTQDCLTSLQSIVQSQLPQHPPPRWAEKRLPEGFAEVYSLLSQLRSALGEGCVGTALRSSPEELKQSGTMYSQAQKEPWASSASLSVSDAPGEEKAEAEAKQQLAIDKKEPWASSASSSASVPVAPGEGKAETEAKQQLAEDKDRLQSEVDRLRQQVYSLEQQLHLGQHQLQQSHSQDKHHWQDQRSGGHASAVVHSTKQLHSVADDLHAENATLRVDMEHLQGRLEKAEAEAEALRMVEADLKSRWVAKLKGKLDDTIKVVEELRSDITRLQRQVLEGDQQRELLQSQLSEKASQLTERSNQLAALQSNVSAQKEDLLNALSLVSMSRGTKPPAVTSLTLSHPQAELSVPSATPAQLTLRPQFEASTIEANRAEANRRIVAEAVGSMMAWPSHGDGYTFPRGGAKSGMMKLHDMPTPATMGDVLQYGKATDQWSHPLSDPPPGALQSHSAQLSSQQADVDPWHRRTDQHKINSSMQQSTSAGPQDTAHLGTVSSNVLHHPPSQVMHRQAAQQEQMGRPPQAPAMEMGPEGQAQTFGYAQKGGPVLGLHSGVAWQEGLTSFKEAYDPTTGHAPQPQHGAHYQRQHEPQQLLQATQHSRVDQVDVQGAFSGTLSMSPPGMRGTGWEARNDQHHYPVRASVPAPRANQMQALADMQKLDAEIELLEMSFKRAARRCA
eukprot:gene4552-14731_t